MERNDWEREGETAMRYWATQWKWCLSIFLVIFSKQRLLWVLCVCAWPCLSLCNPMHCSPPGSSVHRVFQARILERVAISFSRGSSWPRDQNQVSCVSCIAGRFFTCWATREESHYKYNQKLKSDLHKKLIQGRNLEEDVLLLEAGSSLSMLAKDVSSDQERSSSGVGLLQSLNKCLVWKKSYTKQIILDYTCLI